MGACASEPESPDEVHESSKVTDHGYGIPEAEKPQGPEERSGQPMVVTVQLAGDEIEELEGRF